MPVFLLLYAMPQQCPGRDIGRGKRSHSTERDGFDKETAMENKVARVSRCW